MSEQSRTNAKVQKPSAHFDEPHEVVVDASLSQAQKIRALDILEQDARQLAEASSEGMAGGERNKLHDVLIAKDMLTLTPLAGAYETVLMDLRSREKCDQESGTRNELKQAIATLETVITSFEEPSSAVAVAATKLAGGAGY